MRILRDFAEKIKGYKEEVILASLLVFSIFFGFGLGRLSKITERKTPITIEYPIETVLNATNTSKTITKTGTLDFVASKNGTKYYFSWCSGVSKISPQNIVKFATREEAERSGYSKAANCPGL